MSRSESRVRVTKVVRGQERQERADVLAVEEPLEIRVNGTRLAVTMRTPSEDFSLALGFALSEGIISAPEHVMRVRYCQRDQGPHPGGVLSGKFGLPTDLETLLELEEAREDLNIVDITLAEGVEEPLSTMQRAQFVSSSCGMCGRHSLDDVHQATPFEYRPEASNFSLDETLVMDLPELLREDQGVFDKTGGIHAAGLYDVDSGKMLAVREDVGRHNAVDKVLGWALQQGLLPARRTVLVVSSRASFELAQKAAMAGIPMLVAVSAPSSLAVQLAQETQMTLVGFTRENRCNIYSGPQRVNPVTS